MGKSSFFVLNSVAMIRLCGPRGDEKSSRIRLSEH
jgi:hypothetical protein